MTDTYDDLPDPSDQLTEQLTSVLDDAADDDLNLPDYQRYWHQITNTTLDHAKQAWHLAGPTIDAAAMVGTIVRSGQTIGSHLTQLYAARHFGAKFTPFEPGPGIIERPGVDKLTLYSRPIREPSAKAQVNRLETLANTDMQLSKVRTLYSAFDEDQTVNRNPIKIYRRVTTSEKPCGLCEIAADQVYFTTDLMPIHDNCMCDIEEGGEEDLDEHKAAYHHIGFVQTLLDIGDQKKDIETLAEHDAPIEDYHNLVKIEQHGELGPVITWAGQKFTGPADLPNPRSPRPVPTIPGPGAGHEGRLAANRARVAQYRAQHFGPGGRAEPRYAPGHGIGSTYKPMQAPPFGLPPIAKTAGPTPKPKPKPVELAHVIATIGPKGEVTITRAAKEAKEAKIDWATASLDDMLNYMATKHADKVNPASWKMSLWSSPKYNRVAKRNTLQAIDEMLTKYPDVKVGAFKIQHLDKGTVAETLYDSRLDGTTKSITFNSSLMEAHPDTLKAAFKRSEDSGLYFSGASVDPYRAMVYHEFGHVLDVRGGNVARQQATRLLVEEFDKTDEGHAAMVLGSREQVIGKLRDFMRQKDMVSGYSMQDMVIPGEHSPITGKPGSVALQPGEAIAQAFDDVERRGAAASPVSKALHDEVVARARVPYPTPQEPGRAALRTAVDELRERTKPATPWSDAEYAAEDNKYLSAEQRARARQLAEETYIKGASVEPAITAAAQASVEHNGGYMSGLANKLKTGPSLYRKIQAEAIGLAGNTPADVTDEHLAKAAAGIKDSVRYTGIMAPEGYWKSGNDLRKALESLGAKTIKDPQGIPIRGYRGRNMAFEYHGVQFEMQVNTEQGIVFKEINHKIYNDSRKLEADLEARGLDPKDDPKYVKMLDDMQRNWDNIPITKGTPVVPDEKAAKGKDAGQILYVAKDSKFRGPTVPNGEAPLDDPTMQRRAARQGVTDVA